jgi:hypothetical protein
MVMTDLAGGAEDERGRSSTYGVDATGLFYYGPDPVVQLTLDVETRLFTNWVRDLMPPEALSTLIPAQALRPEDRERVDDAAGAAASPGSRAGR